MIEFLAAKIINTLTSPQGTPIDILTVEGNDGFFVKRWQLNKAIGYKSGVVVSTSLLDRIYSESGSAALTVLTKRCRTNNAIQTCVYKVVNILPLLNKIIARHSGSGAKSKNTQRKQITIQFRSWWIKEVLPEYGSKPFSAEEVESAIDATIPLFYGKQAITSYTKPPVLDNEKSRVDFNKIHEQAQKLSEMMNVPQDTALKTIIKLESSRLGYDLSPLLEFLTEGE